MIQISLAADGNILLHLAQHAVKLPLNDRAPTILRSILMADARGASRVGEAGNPTQWDIDRLVAAWTAPKPARTAGIDLDLDLEDML